jgi:hypothetical protein
MWILIWEQGRWAVEDILLISMASILSAFRIEPISRDQIWKTDFDELVVSGRMMYVQLV